MAAGISNRILLFAFREAFQFLGRRSMRVVAALVAVTIFLFAADVKAQSATKPARVGWALAGTEASSRENVEVLRAALRDLGQVEGRSYVLELRYAEGRLERYPELFGELVRNGASVLVAGAYQGTLAARNVTKSVPIVGISCGVELLVESLARPAGNVTGVTCQSPELGPKQMQFFREAVPSVKRIGIIFNPDVPYTRPEVKELHRFLGAAGVGVVEAEVAGPEQFPDAVSSLHRAAVDGVFLVPDNMVYGNRARLGELLLASRLPMMSGYAEFTAVGGLMSYGSNLQALVRRAAWYVDRILRGAAPANLPVEQPTKFELVINLKTAKTLGVKIPQSVLIRADRVIE